MEEEIPASELKESKDAAGSSDATPRRHSFLRRWLSHGDCCVAPGRHAAPAGANTYARAPDNPVILLRDKLRGNIESMRNEEISSIVAAENTVFVAGALAETYVQGQKESGRTTRMLDAIVTNKLIGFPLFFVIMFCNLLGDIRHRPVPYGLD